MEQQIGHITHYFNHLGVAVLNLTEGLQVGNLIHIHGHTTDFTQAVESLEVNHQKVASVGPGADVALKVAQRVHKGDAIYRVVEGR